MGGNGFDDQVRAGGTDGAHSKATRRGEEERYWGNGFDDQVRAGGTEGAHHTANGSMAAYPERAKVGQPGNATHVSGKPSIRRALTQHSRTNADAALRFHIGGTVFSLKADLSTIVPS